MRPDQLALLQDARLSDSARVLGLHVSTWELGRAHRVGNQELAGLLHGIPNEDTVGRHLRQLEVLGYVARTRGGNGTPGTLRWTENGSTGNNHPRKITDDSNSHPRNFEGDTPITRENSSVIRDSSSRKEKVVVTPSISPPELHPDAEKAIAGYNGQLEGFRGALRDYLTARVPTDRQSALVHTLASWRNGMDRSVFAKGDGGQMPEKDQPRLLASALNELAASEESGMKFPAGDVRNLKTKVRILVQQENPRRGRDSSGRPGKTRKDTGTSSGGAPGRFAGSSHRGGQHG